MLEFNYDRETPYWATHFRSQGYYGHYRQMALGRAPLQRAWDWSAVREHHLPENETTIGTVPSHQQKRICPWINTARMPIRILPSSFSRNRPGTRPTLVLLAVLWSRSWTLHSGRPAHRETQGGTRNGVSKDIFPPRPDKPEYMVNLQTNPPHPETGKPMKATRLWTTW